MTTQFQKNIAPNPSRCNRSLSRGLLRFDRDTGENLMAETSLPAGRQGLVPELKERQQKYEDRATNGECYPNAQKYGPSA